MIRKSLALLAVAASLVAAQPALAQAQDHIVSREDMSARLAASESRRQSDLAVVDRVLTLPQAATAAAAVGADLGRLRSALPALSDAELAELAARASAVPIDPVAGLDNDIRTLLIIFLLIAIVILVLQAVD